MFNICRLLAKGYEKVSKSQSFIIQNAQKTFLDNVSVLQKRCEDLESRLSAQGILSKPSSFSNLNDLKAHLSNSKQPGSPLSDKKKLQDIVSHPFTILYN
jgi:16S rRNA G527 N7-methylase RsmG